MTDVAIRNAERERDALAVKVNAAQAQIDDWKREIARIDQFVADWHRFAGTSPEAIPGKSDKATAKRPAGKNSAKEDVARVTRELISVHGTPIQRPVLLNLLRERGLVIEGAEPETVLSTMLWRMSKGAQIVHLKGVGYWMSEKDWPSAGYSPQSEGEGEDSHEADEKSEQRESETSGAFALDLDELEKQLRSLGQR
ncbi:hypothetical protein [Bosea sp. (in: a-proteobacteria)]